MELYEQTEDPEEKIEIIDSYYKFETLPGKQKTYFKQACAKESNMEVRMKLIKMMARFHVPGMTKEIEKLWEYGAYAEAVSIITYEGTWEVKEAWYEKIFEILPQLQELYVKLLDKYRDHENTRFDYKGSQMVLKGGGCGHERKSCLRYDYCGRRPRRLYCSPLWGKSRFGYLRMESGEIPRIDMVIRFQKDKNFTF